MGDSGLSVDLHSIVLCSKILFTRLVSDTAIFVFIDPS